MNSQKIYFPNLNGLRFIAALLVIIHHIEQIKSIFYLKNYWNSVPSILIMGKLGLYLFFVLSGFLITFLLLSEEKSYQSINIKQFYMRRVLRIWPLYFFIIILALFVLPYFQIISWSEIPKEIVFLDRTTKLLLFLFFLPNLVKCTYGIIPFASQAWSIGAEEQFYLIWPIFLKYFKKNRIVLMILIIFGYHYLIEFLTTNFFQTFSYGRIIRDFISTFHIDSMAIGAVFALLLFQKNKILKYLLNNYLFNCTIILVIALIYNGFVFPHFHNIAYSTLFGIIILNFAANNKNKISLENGVLNYLGTISYGLYMYHPIAISIVVVCCKSAGLVTNWLIYPASILLTIALAGLSYKYFETYFLKFKHKFSKITSGNDIK